MLQGPRASDFITLFPCNLFPLFPYAYICPMQLSVYSDEYFMREALKEAQRAFDADEVPVGAIVVCKNQIIARAHNLTETLNDVTAHAEMQAFTSAANFFGGKYLDECTLYVTLEPCIMCAGACGWTQLGRLVYGAFDKQKGYTSVQRENSASQNQNTARYFARRVFCYCKGVFLSGRGKVIKINGIHNGFHGNQNS